MSVQASYVYLLPDPRPRVERTVSLGDDVMFDLDADGRLIGVECLDGADWTGALARMAMAGRVRLT